MSIVVPSRPQVALIAGPTASGKSALAVALAHELERRGRRGVVVNADSAQVYADLAILSARPTEAEQEGVEHRLYGFRDGADPCSAAEWAALARREIEEITGADSVPILCGGTGLYLRTLLDGIAPVPAIASDVRDAVRRMAQDDAYAALSCEDPEAALRIAPADRARTTRALEVVRSTGHPLAFWRARPAGGIRPCVTLTAAILLPDREVIAESCDRRFAHMVENGAIEEVERLLSRGLSDILPIMRAIGVPQIMAHLRGETSKDAMIKAGALATRQYAKRQYTWFRHQEISQSAMILENTVADQEVAAFLMLRELDRR